ncbi:hypothetical protein ACPWR0_07130 [Pandoraea pneumonica]|uniref:hypothetical protein n=1 Tax=Pandoraea pneumonica TaxID=2508299 RepID=UPI003CE7F8AA
MPNEILFAAGHPWFCCLNGDRLAADKARHPSVGTHGVTCARSRDQIQESIVDTLNSLKNVSWELKSGRFTVVADDQIEALIRKLNRTIRKMDNTVWDATPEIGNHLNPLHCFRRYARTQKDICDPAYLSKSARVLYEDLLHIEKVVQMVLEKASDASTRKGVPEDTIAQERLRRDVRRELDALKDSLPSSKNRYNTKMLITVLLTAAGIACTIAAFATPAALITAPVAAALFGIGIALTALGALNTTLNQRFYQRDTGWNELSDLVTKLENLTIEQTEKGMNTVTNYFLCKNVARLVEVSDTINARTAEMSTAITGLQASVTGQSSDINGLGTQLMEQTNDLRSTIDKLTAEMSGIRNDLKAVRTT